MKAKDIQQKIKDLYANADPNWQTVSDTRLLANERLGYHNTLYKKGVKDSAETKAKKSQAHTGVSRPDHSKMLKGRKRPEFAKKMKGVSKGGKVYIITEPNGKQYEIKNLKTFAKKLNKPLVTAREMAYGKYPNHTCKRGAWKDWIIKFKLTQ